MDAIAPDLPGEGVEPGVSSSSAPRAVAGDDADSLFRAANLQPALDQLADQLGAGQGITTLHIEPGTLNAETAEGSGLFAPGDVPADVPAMLADEIDAERPAARAWPTSPTWIWSRRRRARAGTCSSTSTATSGRRRGPTARRSPARR